MEVVFVTNIGTRGTITIPKKIRDAGYGTGKKVRVILKLEGPADDLENEQTIFCRYCNSAIFPEEAKTEHCPHCGKILEGE
ncbi:MAG: hypothetical protein ACTSRR_09710 [Candidatus Heimdallarchaeaceae archaeon]